MTDDLRLSTINHHDDSIRSGVGSNNPKSKNDTLPSDVVVSEAGGSKVDDAIFGAINEDGPKYRDVAWLGTAVLMTKTQIGLGVLSIPFVLQTLGLIPGIICLLAVAIITTWSDYVVGTFKRNHPDVYGVDDVGYLLFRGKVGKEIIGAAFWLYMTFVSGSGLLGISIGFNAISNHGVCTAVFVAVAAVITVIFASVQTLGKISWLGWVGLVSIMSALITLTISVALQDRPAAAPQTGPWDKGFILVGKPSFTEAISSISTLVFSYAGTPAFFGIASEMKEPRFYTRAMLMCQTIVTVAYLTIGIICGWYNEEDLLWISFTRTILHSDTLHSPSCQIYLPLHRVVLLRFRLCAFFICNCKCHSCVWWVGRINRCPLWYLALDATDGGIFLLGFNIFIVIIGTFLMVAGTYGSVVDIIASAKASGGGKPWTCADNSA
ncbi:uncharacterized protein L201_003850 [Kwoniella dendrophila CBS 6074]|uniref:Amino acid transporter transmembrane domain-containing protein n=1 Tax=Kwoniella dendrophila CBS 6074 TaxID=1295534 RepID=A0AAX4JWP4_9TREE